MKTPLPVLICTAILSTASTFAADPAPAAPVKTDAPTDTSANTLTDAEKAAGWRLLFDGTSLTGWHNFKKGRRPRRLAGERRRAHLRRSA